jgi:hypothetical protein
MVTAAILLAACGRGTIYLNPNDAGSTNGDGGACDPNAITQGSDLDAGHNHVALGTMVQYDTNPPCAGDHWPVWATWGVHSDIVAPEYFVHNLEHGGVVLLYNCPQDCPDLVAELQAFLQAQPIDPLCQAQGTGVPNRFLLTSDPDLDAVWAASAWGYYLSSSDSCLNVDALNAFVAAHYGNGREALCAQGLFE